MRISIQIPKKYFDGAQRWWLRAPLERVVLFGSIALAFVATCIALANNVVISYGDAESHLNIAKRVVDSLTPGPAQLGGIWLPLPHILMLPFIGFDFFWRTGLAGSIVSGAAYVLAATFLFKLTYLLTNHRGASLLTAAIFMLNPNILYLQATPMTELPLIAFFVLSSYYFVKFLYNRQDLIAFILAAFYGFCATLSRYDGWFLVMLQAAILAAIYFPYAALREHWQRFRATNGLRRRLTQFWNDWRTNWGMFAEMDGRIVLFCTLAFFGIALWLLWDGLILGDPLYFTHSEFSAKSQQQGWQSRGELPSYHNIPSSFAYYFVTAMSNSGPIVFLVALLGLAYFVTNRKSPHRQAIATLLAAPFFFYVLTLWLGQSIIFIPHLTPTTFEWTLFNVRYGVMMVPAVALWFGYLFFRSRTAVRWLLLVAVAFQFALYGIGYSPVISLDDGIRGLSSSKRPDAEIWMQQNYDHGLVVLDDFSRLISIIRTDIPMQNIIYIGNKPYWEESLETPEKYATWLVIQKGDTIWKTMYEPLDRQGYLYAHFTKVYTSPEILIFKRTSDIAVNR